MPASPRLGLDIVSLRRKRPEAARRRTARSLLAAPIPSWPSHLSKVYLNGPEVTGHACLPEVREANQPQEVRPSPEAVRHPTQTEVQRVETVE